MIGRLMHLVQVGLSLCHCLSERQVLIFSCYTAPSSGWILRDLGGIVWLFWTVLNQIGVKDNWDLTVKKGEFLALQVL